LGTQEQPLEPRQGGGKDAIDVHRLGDILQAALTDVLERHFFDLANLIVDGL
jgi:hypothetical protein